MLSESRESNRLVTGTGDTPFYLSGSSAFFVFVYHWILYISWVARRFYAMRGGHDQLRPQRTQRGAENAVSFKYNAKQYIMGIAFSAPLCGLKLFSVYGVAYETARCEHGPRWNNAYFSIRAMMPSAQAMPIAAAGTMPRVTPAPSPATKRLSTTAVSKCSRVSGLTAANLISGA